MVVKTPVGTPTAYKEGCGFDASSGSDPSFLPKQPLEGRGYSPNGWVLAVYVGDLN